MRPSVKAIVSNPGSYWKAACSSASYGHAECVAKEKCRLRVRCWFTVRDVPWHAQSIPANGARLHLVRCLKVKRNKVRMGEPQLYGILIACMSNIFTISPHLAAGPSWIWRRSLGVRLCFDNQLTLPPEGRPRCHYPVCSLTPDFDMSVVM